MLAEPASGFHDLEGIGGRHERLAQDRVGVKRNWSDETLQLTFGKRFLGLIGRARSRLRLLRE